MTPQTTDKSLSEKIGMPVGVVGITIAFIAGAFCLIPDQPSPDANGWLIIGVGLMAIAGAILATPVVVQGVRDLRKLVPAVVRRVMDFLRKLGRRS